MLLILDYKLTLYRSLWPKLAAPYQLSWSISVLLVIRQCASRACNSYLPSPKLLSMSRSFPSFSPLESRPQSDIEIHASPPVNLSPDAIPRAFTSPNAVVAPIVIPKRCPSRNAPFPELLIHPHHFRRSSLSITTICIAEIARLRETSGTWKSTKPLVNNEWGNSMDD
jgi:hypothetical protein